LYGKPSTRTLSPKWSPDGKWIAFIAQETERDEIYLVPPSGEGLHPLTHRRHDVAQFEWSPDSKQLVVIFNRSGIRPESVDVKQVSRRFANAWHSLESQLVI
jgi:Tol biopolymer transport system component